MTRTDVRTGFDEGFRGWGVEDIELGYRLHHHGLPMVVSREAWGIEAPHERAAEANRASILTNCQRFLDRHPEIQPELYWAVSHRGLVIPLEEEGEDVLAWAATAHDRDVQAEIEGAAAAMPEGSTLAIVGCGGEPPIADLLASQRLVLIDFDQDLLSRAERLIRETAPEVAERCTFIAGLGTRTTLPEKHCDRVVITSRMADLWPRWSAFVLAEAHRIGVEVRTSVVGDQATGPAGAA